MKGLLKAEIDGKEGDSERVVKKGRGGKEAETL
jgi:hypothetical protein